ncbi:MAG TPA: DUF1598 domain-containing protein [Planctomycetaceae bacterium]|nr:DUF1598 domain-containing protein [Planctomycetaceae bacterium]
MTIRSRRSVPIDRGFGMLCVAATIFLLGVRSAPAQFGAVGGVSVDPQGMLRHASTLAPDERLAGLRAEALARPPAEVAQASPLRKISLRRLEEAVARLYAAGQPLPSDLRHLAGLTAVRYVFIDPEAGDVILAGPAEGWSLAETGEVVGTRSGRPVLHLDDLVVALRFAFGENPADGFIGCSIDPTEEGVKNYATYMRRLGAIDRARIGPIFTGMERAMGPQAIRLFGVEESSRTALVLVAADYRLKRIALGHDPSPVREVVNYLDLSARRFNRRAAQKQHRWWFMGHYDAVYHTPDELAFELAGQGVKVVTARTPPTSASAGGDPTADPDGDPPSPAAVEFADALTKHFAAVAEALPVFLELQNLVGLATAAELTAQSAGAGGWKPLQFLDARACPLERSHVPQTVPSLANYRLIQGRNWLISVSGGVEIDPRDLAGRRFRRESPERGLAELRAEARRPAGTDRWWWD